MKTKRTFYSARIALVISLFLQACTGSGNSSKQDSLSSQSVEEYSTESIYQTSAKWDNQEGDTLQLSQLSGKIPVVSMVFTRCTFSCPKTVADLKAIEDKLPPDKKDKVVFVLISFDSDRDHTKELKAFSKQMQLSKNWMVLHGNPDDVRELSMLLDVKYKKQPNGDFTHSPGITVLDTKGVVASQSEGLGKDPSDMVKVIQSL
ncbi:SCO family protein [Arcticibacter eurypsychrophilus]|uniref:SCO family protein n=1 Tax=Arcticibacter eurypsychrophilus TaxID=1434752 RepID=UPI00147C1328|nr:SCO family protein [Arcticibacter eurypsychrophilus]